MITLENIILLVLCIGDFSNFSKLKLCDRKNYQKITVKFGNIEIFTKSISIFYGNSGNIEHKDVSILHTVHIVIDIHIMI